MQMKAEARLGNKGLAVALSLFLGSFLEHSMGMILWFGSQLIKLSQLRRSFCFREILSGPKKIPLFWWKI